jgi:hypothetical protein
LRQRRRNFLPASDVSPPNPESQVIRQKAQLQWLDAKDAIIAGASELLE